MSSIAVAELSPSEQRQLSKAHPEISRGESALVISAPRSVLSAIEQVAERISWERAQSERILEALVDDDAAHVLNQPRVLQLHRQAELRADFLRRFETLTSAGVAALGGSSARNSSALANRWKKEGKIFAVGVGRADRFPAFQFGDDGKPLPVVAEVIEAFDGESGWTVALWLAAPSGWLNGLAPVDVLRTDPAGVAEAARRSAEPLIV
jgi:hypothetical protein